MQRSRLVLLGAALLPISLVVGCASSETGTKPKHASSAPSTKLNSTFLARAETVCGAYAKYNSEHYFRADGFNRFAPDVARLPRVAAYLGSNPSYRTLDSDLEALGRPESGGAAWGAVLHDVSAGEALVRKQIVSARKRDGAGFEDIVKRLELNIRTLQADLQKLGLSAGSPCWGMQRDPLASKPEGE